VDKCIARHYMSARYYSPLGYYAAILFLLFLGLFQCWFTAMPLSPVSTYVHASFAKFICSRFCSVLLCIWCLQINWIGLEMITKFCGGVVDLRMENITDYIFGRIPIRTWIQDQFFHLTLIER